ncbi:MAG: polysaccharide pyruvyl transferase family protein [Rhizobiales bacterium]|nr:polysaccharide pyruvyl transferase family protein [Hyphomicrobiales bacterium]
MKVASFAFTTPNLGDDLQVMATVRRLPQVDRLVDRDFMSEHRYGEPHAVVMNSWFQLGRRSPTFPHLRRRRLDPSTDYKPIFHGFCVGSDKILSKGWADYLRAHRQVGCRDRESAEKLASMGVDAFWSGCLTLTLGMGVPPVPAEARRGVYIVDVPEAVERDFVPDELRQVATRFSNEAPADLVKDPLARMHRMAAICDRLRHAELVITRRLHTALPCVGFGTPVRVLVEEKPNNTRRFSGFEDFVPVSFYGGQRKPKPLHWGDRTPAEIPQNLREALARLDARIAAEIAAPAPPAYPSVALTTRIVLPNPGLGARPGRIAFDLGRTRVTREPAFWTDKKIFVDVQHFAGFDRFATPILAQAVESDEWVPVGRVDQAISEA